MGRALRAAAGGLVYHVLNRANARATLFEQPGDYLAFEKVLGQAGERYAVDLLAYCVMPNHWHLVLRPRRDGELSRYVGWLTLTHTQRWHAHHQSVGSGHLYQGRFKSFPIEADEHFLIVCRYVERNPLRAGLVKQAAAWRWGSLWRRDHSDTEPAVTLADWPVERPARWQRWVQEPQSEAEQRALQRCLQRGQPFGSDAWVGRTARRLGLETTLRPRGRPKKEKKGS